MRIVHFMVYWFISLQQEQVDIEEKYSSLQEEIQGKTKKLKKVWTMLMQAKSEVGGSHCMISHTIQFYFTKFLFDLKKNYNT